MNAKVITGADVTNWCVQRWAALGWMDWTPKSLLFQSC